jgi:hypothetical protein
MLLLIDIFSINKGRGYENPSLEIIVTERCSTGGFPLEEACEHCFLNQSAISVVVLILFLCYCGDYAGYITVILPFLAFYFCSAYLLYLVSCKIITPPLGINGICFIEFPHQTRKFLFNLTLGEPLALVQELPFFDNSIKLDYLVSGSLNLCVHNFFTIFLSHAVRVDICWFQLLFYL